MTAPSPSLKELFLAALEVAPDERAAWLHRKCAADAGLCEQVNLMLAAHDTPQSLFDRPEQAGPIAALLDRANLSPTIGPSAAESIGTAIGPYKLLEQIGEGGMGLVYMAEQQQPVRRLVALKLIKPGMDSKQVIARFEAERQALAMMDHPNIAKVHDAGTTETGRPYFVMELVRGIPLNEFCDQKHLTVRERLQLFVQVCQAVQHAHQKGIIHRDLKPTNVLVTMADTVAFPKLLDFGIAKALGQSLTDNTLHTGYAQLVGTPLYMSPEQAEMNLFGVDTRSDVYSLGVLLYELLTGQTPFDKDTLSKAGLDEMRRIIREDEPLRPSRRFSTLGASAISTASQHRSLDERRLSKILRGELDWIVMKTLEKDRNRRYESASSLATDIQRYLSDEPVLACPPTAMYRFQKFARKHKAAFTTAAAIAVCLLLGTTVSAWQAVRATSAEAQAEANEQKAVANEQKANANAAQAQEKAQEATTQRDEAQRQRDEVESLNKKLLATQELLERMLYASDLSHAKLALDVGVTNRAVELLDKHRPKARERDQRGFEWHYLDRLSSSSLPSVNTGRGLVNDLAISPDGKRMAASTLPSKTAKVWDVQSGREIAALSGHDNPVWSVAFSPDGKLLATASGEQGGKPTGIGEAKVWRIDTGEEVLTIKDNHIGCVAFSPDGKRLASGTFDGMVKVWDAHTGTLMLTLNGHTEVVEVVVFSPDGKYLASASNDKTAKLWDADSGAEGFTLKGHDLGVIRVAFSSDSRSLATSSYDRTVKVWNVESGRETFTLRGHSDHVPGIDFSPDGRHLASASVDGTVKIWDAQTGAENATLRALRATGPQTFASVAFNPDGTRLAAGGWGSIQQWDAGLLVPTIIRSKNLGAAAFSKSPSGDRLALIGGDTAAIWDLANRRELLTLKYPEILAGEPRWGELYDLSFSPDGKQLAISGTRGWDEKTGKDLGSVLKILDAQTGELIRDLSGDYGVGSVAFSPDGKRLAAMLQFGKDDFPVRIWDVGSWSRRLDFKGHEKYLTSLVYSPDGKSIVSTAIGSKKNAIRWNAETGDEIFALDLPQLAGRPMQAAFAPSGSRIAIAAFNKVLILSAQNGERLLELSAHTDNLTQVEFSPDGRRLVTSTRDGFVTFWDSENGQELLTFAAFNSAILTLAFSPDGQHLAVGDSSVVKILDATPVPEDLQRQQGQFWPGQVQYRLPPSKFQGRQITEGWHVREFFGNEPVGYEIGLDSEIYHGGSKSAFIKSNVADRQRSAPGLWQSIRADNYRGKRVRLSGFAKANQITGFAFLMVEMDSETKLVNFDNMPDRRIVGTRDWQKYEIVLDVPEDSVSIRIGFNLVASSGQIWVDDLQFEIVGQDVPTTGPPPNSSLLKNGQAFSEKNIAPDQAKPVNLDFEK